MTFTAQLVESLAPLVTPETDPTGDHREYLTALGQMFEEIWSLSMDQGFPDDPNWVPGWGVLLDVDTCPFQYLPYLAQFVGAVIPAGTDDLTARSIIRQEQGMQRGTAPAIIAAATRSLSGTQSIALEERTAADGTADAYHFVLVVRPEEIIDLAVLTAAVDSVKPGGVLWTLIQSDAPLLSQYTRLFSAITVPINAATLADVT